MALAPNVWAFTFILALIASVGYGVNNTVHNSYLSDAYPTEGRGRIFSWHNLSDPLSNTIGILVFGLVIAVGHSWRWGMLIALAGIPIALSLFTLREPDKGQNESSHILKASGMDVHTQQERCALVLLGSAVTRLLRIRSLYFELVAVAILGFAGTAAPLFGNLYFVRRWGLDTAQRSEVYSIIGLAAFLGLPLAYVLGDRYFRRAPQRPLIIAGFCITAYGGLYVASLYMPQLWMVVTLQFLANAAVSPLAICIFLTLAATAPAEMRTICFAMFGVYALVFGGFAGAVLLGAVSDAVGFLHGPTVALTLIGPVCVLGGIMLLIGSRYVRRDITMVIEDVLERHAEGQRRKEGGELPALQVHNLDVYYGANQVLFGVDFEVGQGEIVALLGTNGAGKSTLLRTVAGLEHPHRGVIRIQGTTCTYLEPEQIIEQDVALLVGGKMTFPGLTVRDNLQVGAYSLRHEGARARSSIAEALELFPALAPHLHQQAGTLSGGEQQMLALARVMLTAPKLLLIDELALGLAPKAVDRLMAIVREVNRQGTTVVLVEQSVNRAMSLAERAVFIERGEVRFDGLTTDLLERTDLLRPVFLGAAADRSGVSGMTVSIPSFVLVQGVATGVVYGLLAMGLVLIYRANRVLNFAQGQLGVVAAVFLVKCFYDFGFNYWFALLLALGLAAGAGALSELLLRRLFNRPRVLVMVATIGLSQVLFVFTALPFIRPSNLFKAFPVPFDLSVHHRHVPLHSGTGACADRRPAGGARPGGVRPVVAMGPRHAGHHRERRLSPTVGGVGAAHVDRGLDVGRCALGVHRDPRVAGPGQLAHPGAQPRAVAARADRRHGRRHGQSDRGLRGRGRGGSDPGGAGVEPVQHGPGRSCPLPHRVGGPAGPHRRPPDRGSSEERSTWLESSRRGARRDALRRTSGRRTGGVVGDGGRRPVAFRSLGGQHRTVVPHLADLHLRHDRPVSDRAHRLGGPGLARTVRSGRLRRADGRPPSATVSRWSCSCRSPARSPR